jgi:hypothetical protein
MPNEIDPLWEDLILAILSVNRYSLEKIYLAWTPEEIGIRLRRGGYDRGDFMTNLFANRLASLGAFIKSTGVKECERILRKGKTSEINQFLQPIKGIGPQVLINFLLLRNASSKLD